MTHHYDTIFVGTSFASSFFLKRYLELAPKTVRILVLERGNSDTKAWQLENRKTSSIDVNDVFINKQPEKEWLVSPGFGGNSKCWWGGASRMMPGDFQLRSRYGVGTDWPMSYDELEPYYGEVESIMAVSGPSDHSTRAFRHPGASAVRGRKCLSTYTGSIPCGPHELS